MATPLTAPPYNAEYDANRNSTLIVTTGTPGTADTAGTAEVMRVGGNPTTGAMYVQDLGGGVAGTFVNIATGTQQTLGTVGVLNNGTLAQVTSVSNLAAGTLTRIEGGTVTVLGVGTFVNIVTGTQQTLGTVGVLNTGTIAALASGTITGGTLQNIVGGTITPSSATGFEGGTVAVGTAAVELTFTGVTRGVMITADHNNGTMIYIGPSTVTQAGANAVARIDPGESLSVEDFTDASAALYAVAGTTAQKAYKVAFT